MTGAEAHWRAALAEGRFLLQRGCASGRAFFPPRIAEPGTGDSAEWFEASGEGRVYSVTVVARKPPETPYAVVLVELAEGPRVMSRIEGVAPDAIRIGMAVKARIIADDGAPLLVFEPA
jgi:uncharacterized protein